MFESRRVFPPPANVIIVLYSVFMLALSGPAMLAVAVPDCSGATLGAVTVTANSYEAVNCIIGAVTINPTDKSIPVTLSFSSTTTISSLAVANGVTVSSAVFDQTTVTNDISFVLGATVVESLIIRASSTVKGKVLLTTAAVKNLQILQSNVEESVELYRTNTDNAYIHFEDALIGVGGSKVANAFFLNQFQDGALRTNTTVSFLRSTVSGTNNAVWLSCYSASYPGGLKDSIITAVDTTFNGKWNQGPQSGSYLFPIVTSTVDFSNSVFNGDVYMSVTNIPLVTINSCAFTAPTTARH